MDTDNIFDILKQADKRPESFAYYTVEQLWNDEYISGQMLKYHLDPTIDLASRKPEFINKSAAWIEKQFGLTGRKVADFGCGPGLYASKLAERGAKITGIDISRRSIEFARNKAEDKNLDINYVNCNYLDFESDQKFDLIIMIFCDFCVLSPVQRQKLLVKFKNLLNDNGHILLDVVATPLFNELEESTEFEFNMMHNFWSADDYYCLKKVFLYPDQRVALDKYTIFEKNRIRKIYNWMQFYDKESISAEFNKAGLIVHEFAGNVCGDSFEASSQQFAIIAGNSSITG